MPRPLALALVAVLLTALCPPATAEVGYAREVAVVISIGEYARGWEKLPNAARDGQRFAMRMRARGAKVFELRDAQATRAGILRTLDAAGRAAAGGAEKPGLLIVYFAGHGETRGPASNPQGYLVPYDGKPGDTAQWLSMGLLRQKAAELDAVQHQLWILGACFSGSIIQVRSGEPAAVGRDAEQTARWLKDALVLRARRVIAAGGRDQTVADGPSDAAGSKFGDALVSAITPQADGLLRGDRNRDGCVDDNELAGYVKSFGGEPGFNTPVDGFLPRHRPGADIALCARTFATPTGQPRVEGPLRSGERSTLAAPDRFVAVGPASLPWEMGSAPGEFGRAANETRHQVRLSRPFEIQSREVTQRQWAALMGNRPALHGGCGEDCPVERVNWYEAAAYANARSRAAGRPACYVLEECGPGEPGAGCPDDRRTCDGWRCERVELVGGLACAGYRLPTEAEWEYAARAGSRLPFSPLPSLPGATQMGGALGVPGRAAEPLGARSMRDRHRARLDGADTQQQMGELSTAARAVGWARSNSGMRTHPVGLKPANGWGAQDMHGNVAEWCHDGWASYPDAGARRQDPMSPFDPARMVVRGGAFDSEAAALRSASRRHAPAAERSGNRGFRLVRTLEP